MCTNWWWIHLTDPHISETTTTIKVQNISNTPRPRQPLICFFFFFNIRDYFAFSRTLNKWNHTVCTLVPLLSFSTMLLRFIPVAVCSIVHYFLLLSSIPLYKRNIHFVHPFTCWWIFGLFPVSLWRRQLWRMFRHEVCVCSFSWVNTQEWNFWVVWKGYGLLQETNLEFSKVMILFFILTNSLWAFWLLHIPTNTY